MSSLTRSEFEELIAKAAPRPFAHTDEEVIALTQTWLDDHFGVGTVERVVYGYSGEDEIRCTAMVGGLPLDPRQALVIDVRITPGNAEFFASLMTSDDEAPYADCDSATGPLVVSLADFAGLLA